MSTQIKPATKNMASKGIVWDVVALIGLLLLCDTAAQLFFKRGVNALGAFPLSHLHAVPRYLQALVNNGWILLGMASILGAFFCWLATIARVDLSKAHTVSCLAYGSVPLCSAWLLHEAFSLQQAIGVLLIIIGAYIASEHAPYGAGSDTAI